MNSKEILKQAHSKGLDRYEIANWLQSISKEPKGEFFKALENEDSFKDCIEVVRDAVLMAHTNWYQSTLTEKKKQEKIELQYRQKCTTRLSNMISVFEKRFKDSGDRELLLKQEIALYKKLLKTKDVITDNDKFYLPNQIITQLFQPAFKTVSLEHRALSQFEIEGIREKYDRIIINGFRDFNDNSEFAIQAEIFNAYYEYIKNIKLYTFESWLNDEIDFKMPGGTSVLEAENGLATLCFGLKMLSKHDLDQIQNHQLEAFNIAVELSVKSKIKAYEKQLTGAINKDELYELELELSKEKLNKDRYELSKVVSGKKKYLTLKGSQYKKIILAKDKFEAGKSIIFGFNFNDNMRLTVLYKYVKWLEEKKNSNVKKEHSEKNDPKEFHEYLKHDNREEFANSLRDKYKYDVGKTIAIMLYCLKECGAIVKEENGYYPVRDRIYKSLAKLFDKEKINRSGINDFLDENFDYLELKKHKSEVSKHLQIIKNIGGYE